MPTKTRALEIIRDEITAVQARLEALRHTVLPLNMALDRLQSWVDAQHQAYDPRGLTSFMHPGAAFNFKLTADATPNDMTQLVCGLCSETVYADLKARLEAHYAAHSDLLVMTPDAQDEAVRAAREELRELEREEEAAIRAVEAEGKTIVRRADVEHIEALLED